MTLLEKINSDLKTAMKSNDSVTVQTLKMIKSDISYEKGKTGEDLEEDAILQIVARAAKRRKESISEYKKGNREDLAEAEEAELKIIEQYLPEQMGEEELEAMITEKLDALGSVTKKDFGRIMGELMKDFKGKVDGKMVKDILNKRISDE